MSAILTAAGTVFSAIFGSTGYVVSLVNLITQNDFLLLGVSLMVAGSVCAFLSRLIHTA